MLTKKLLFASLLSVSGLMTKAQSTTTVNDFGKTASFQVDIQPDAKSTAFRLVVQNPKKKNLKLTISHQDFGVLVDTVINSEEYKSRYTFDEAVDGRYILVLQNGKEKYAKQIELSTVTMRKMRMD
jgi:hypothetical protein